MNIANILKDCPEGTKLYSPLYGDVYLRDVGKSNYTAYPIVVKNSTIDTACFAEDGRFYTHHDEECLLFPSKTNRDWSTFKSPKKYSFKPFDKVLVRDSDEGIWEIGLFSRINENPGACRYVCMFTSWNQCIPYEGNEHLLGTTDNPE